MIEIKDLLLRFNDLLLSGELKKESIQKAIEEAIGIQIKSKDLKIEKGTIYLNIKPIYKNEILIKRDLIDKKIYSYLGERAPKNIR